MTDTYFHRIAATTPTRLWVNNPTQSEVEHALTQGAVGCTTNPSFGGNLLKRASEEVRPLVQVCAGRERTPERIADLVQRDLVARIALSFRPLFDETAGKAGYVSIQGAPDRDTDGDAILEEAREGHAIAPNVAPKIPATVAGLYAFERVVADGYPTIVTEVFSLAQLVETCERYLAVTARTGLRPRFFVSPITGIFGDHLRKLAAAQSLSIEPSLLEWAGVALARACYRVVSDRGYPVTLLFGGARTMVDFTGLVGGETAATINYSTVEEIIAADPAVDATIDDPVDPAIVARLSDAFADFEQAMRVDGLTPEQFEAFGPVQHFRDNFVAGWNALLSEVDRVSSAPIQT